MRTFILLTCALAVSGIARAETDLERRARQEVEQELASQIQIPAGRLQLVIHPVADPNLELDTVEAELDGRALTVRTPSRDELAFDAVPVYDAEIASGEHRLRVRLTYKGEASYGRDYGFSLARGLEFQAQRGLAVGIHPRIEIDAAQEDWNERFDLVLEHRAVMLAPVDASAVPEHRPAVLPEEAPAAPVRTARAPAPSRPAVQPVAARAPAPAYAAPAPVRPAPAPAVRETPEPAAEVPAAAQTPEVETVPEPDAVPAPEAEETPEAVAEAEAVPETEPVAEAEAAPADAPAPAAAQADEGYLTWVLASGGALLALAAAWLFLRRR